MDNTHIRKTAKITLGATTAMTTAILMTGCSTSSAPAPEQNATSAKQYVDVKADYAEICKNIENNHRAQDDNCLDSSSTTAQWYYMPIYSNDDTVVPAVGKEVSSQAVDTLPEGKIKTSVSEEKQPVLLKAAEGYGVENAVNPLEASEYMEVCIDEQGNRVDDTQCQVGDTPDNSGSGGGHSLVWLPMFFGGHSSYVPPVGSQVDTSQAIKDRSQINTKNIQKAPKEGINIDTKSVNSKNGAKGNDKGSVSRGGTGSSGKAGG